MYEVMIPFVIVGALQDANRVVGESPNRVNPCGDVGAMENNRISQSYVAFSHNTVCEIATNIIIIPTNVSYFREEQMVHYDDQVYITLFSSEVINAL